MPVESPVSYVYYLNNKSCCFIKQGLYEEATENLKIALERAREIALVSSSKERDRSISVRRSCPPTSACDEFKYTCHSESKKLHTTSSESDSSFVFRTPVFVDETMCDEDPNLSNASCYIVFNLSLAYHLKALENKEDKGEANKFLSVARNLYELTFRMQNANNSESSDLLLTAAVLNNISTVHNALNNKNEMHACLQLLLSALVILVDTRCLPPLLPSNTTTSSTTDNTHPQHIKNILDGFVGNVMHLIIRDPFAASAA